MAGVLAPDFVARAPVRDDAQGIGDLIVAADVALIGESDFELSSLFEDWEAPKFDLARDAQVVVSADGQIAGYESILSVRENGRILTDGYVHPDYTDQGGGTYLLGWAESRACEHIPTFPPERRVFLHAGTFSSDGKAADLFQSLGYAVIRHFWRMEIDLTAPQVAPTWPDGITMRTYAPEQDDRVTWQAVNEAFMDHWGYSPESFEDWSQRAFPTDFDPTLWFLAMAGDQVAGIALCNYRMGDGWVRTLGVRRPWRQQGLGMALLQHSFGEFFRRGKKKVGLGVDAQNLTGATRLYERAGMHIAERFDTYEKELRPGV